MSLKNNSLPKGFAHALLKAIDNPGRPMIGYAYNVGRWHRWPKVPPVYYRRAVERMKQQGWIKETVREGKIFLKLTQKGRVRVLFRRLQELKKPDRKKWDGSWWLGLFDIPEATGRRDRHELRRALRCAGFIPLQKSVYLFPGKIPEVLVQYLRASGLSKFIRFLHVDRADDPQDLKRRCRFS